MRKIIGVILIAYTVIIFLNGCSMSTSKSNYDTLNDVQKKVVDTVLEHSYEFSDCNMIKFGNARGAFCFVTCKETNNNGTVFLLEGEKYYIVGENKFIQDKYDAWKHATVMSGFLTSWDSTWDTDRKKEALSVAIKNYDIVSNAEKETTGIFG